MAATEDLEQLRKIGVRAALFFIATTILAIIIGLPAQLTAKLGLDALLGMAV